VTLAALLLVATAAGQSPDFVAQARAGTARYRDVEVARAAGYRPVGPDFPGMGRHWVHPALILRDTLDPAAPPILEYAEIAGRPTLVGVAYAMLVRGGTPPPPPPLGLPVPPAAWHFHQGTVEEESFLRSHAGVVHVVPGEENAPRIAVLHAWIWLENPDGLLATDNWALPYARLGYRMPPGAPREAARALALAAGGGDGGRNYVEALLRAVGRPSAAEGEALALLVARHQAAARALLPSDPGGSAPVEALAHCWTALLADVRAAVRPEVWERLLALHPL
jgi:hypothetical protein